ncbi:MAG TPA: EAL domain-containing protein [Vicinamibacteria bacterium]|nr:EAL domain-containing protein [Vicinamibacteria bacterium]
MYLEIPTYHERLDELAEQLREHGHLGLLLIDASELAQVEHDYGSRAFEQVLSLVSGLVRELQGAEVRAADLLALNERGGNAFLLFLSPRRGEADGRPRIADLEAIRGRVEEQLNHKLSSFSSPYLRGRRKVTVGYAVVFHNPLIMAERVVARLVKEASESIDIQKAQAHFQTRCRLQDVMLGQQIMTVFQPIIDLQHGGRHGFEALSRGPAGTQQHSPLNLFEAAKESDLTFELDRHCRRRALRTAHDLPSPNRLFINVVPASMYDPDLQGASLIELLEGMGLSPARIALEVSERYAINNYRLFVEALETFRQLGFSIAVDDIGAGHSGLENIAHLQPRYLKFDMQLVQDIDKNPIKREMARALKTFADKMDSQIVAEGIEREGERQACVELGLHYGQGFLLARPAPLETFSLGAEAAPSSVRE